MEDFNVKYLMKKYPFQVYLCITIVSIFCFEIIGTIGISSITNNSSEYNVIAMAADLAGYDWKDTILKTHYYGYTASILFSSAFMFKPIVSNPMILLHSLLLINILINIICACILFLIISNIVNEHKWKVNYPIIALITITCSLIISNQVLTKNATNENLFMLCYYIAIYIITCSNKKGKKKSQIINSIFLALVCIIAYATNGRGIILIIITFLMYLVFKIFKLPPFGNLIIFFITFSFLFILSQIIKDYFVGNYFQMPSNTSVALINSDAKGVIKKAYQLLNPKGLKLCIKLVIGWGTYFIVSTYGLGIIAILYAIQCIFNKIKHFDEMCNIDFILAIIILFFMIGMSILGICFYYDSFYAMTYDSSNALANGRVDKLIYGRYISTIKSIILSYGLINIIYANNLKTKTIYISLIIFAFFEILFYKEIVPLMIDKRYAAVDIPEFALFFQNFESNYKFGIIKSYLPFKLIFNFTIICYIALLYIAKNKLNYIFLYVILILNISIGIAYTFDLSFPRTKYYRNLINQEQVEYIRNTYNENSLIITDNNTYLYQFFIPCDKVISFNLLDEESSSSYEHLIFVNPSESILNDIKNNYKEANVLIISENELDSNFYLLKQHNAIKEYIIR